MEQTSMIELLCVCVWGGGEDEFLNTQTIDPLSSPVPRSIFLIHLYIAKFLLVDVMLPTATGVYQHQKSNA